MTTEKNRRGSAPTLQPYALALNVMRCDVETADFTTSPEIGEGHEDAAEPGRQPLVLADALPRPRGLIVDDSAVYVLVFPSRPAGSGQLLQIDRESGLISVLASLVRPDALAADADFIYWTEIERGAVKRIAKQGGDIVTLATGENLPTCLAVGDAGVFWATRGFDVVRASDEENDPAEIIAHFDSAITGLAVDGVDLLVGLDSGELWRVSIDGVARQLFLTGECFSRGFVIDSRSVYWIDDETGVIKSFAKRGGGQVKRMAEAPGGDGQLVVTDDALLWSDARARVIRRLRKDGTRSIAAAELPHPAEIATWGEWIAWINRGDGSVMTMRE